METTASPRIVREPEFRRVLGHLPTGVTVVAALTSDGPVGMTANSVTSVSLDPPMILFCPSSSSTTWRRIRTAREFCISVLADGDEALARRFSQRHGERFAGVAWHERAAGLGIDAAVAWIECSIRKVHRAGDHVIVVGDVLEVEASGEPQPLIFWRGTYGRFAG
jgi:3-hydroxy-9,10-secoandrosta-1,3,5(10)-triene-9,17-dione monooxygenase reductase component